MHRTSTDVGKQHISKSQWYRQPPTWKTANQQQLAPTIPNKQTTTKQYAELR